MFLTLRKGKKDCNILEFILAQGFCPSKREMARFAIRFRLKHSLPSYYAWQQWPSRETFKLLAT